MSKLSQEEMQIITTTYQNMQPIKEKYLEAWRLVSKYIDPTYGNMNTSKPPESVVVPSNRDIYNTTVYYYSYLAAAGLKSYTCSSQANFFNLEFEDKDSIDRDQNVIQADLQRRTLEIYKMLRRSSFYASTQRFFKSYLDLSTAIMIMGESEDKSTFYYEDVPSYQCTAIKNMQTKEVVILYRSQWLTYYDARARYGEDALSRNINDEGKKNPMKTFEFVQMFAKRDCFYDINFPNNYEWIEVVYATEDKTKAVFVGGDNYKPFVVANFSRSDDISGFGVGGPGMRQCFNSMGLQSMTKDQIVGSEYAAKKPIMKSEGMNVSIKPAGFIDIPPGGTIQPLNLGADMSWNMALIQKFEQQAKADYFVDFFLMLSQYQGNVNTATLAQGLQNEQVSMLKGFLDDLGSQFFEPIIEWTWGKMCQRGLFGRDNLSELSFDKLKIDYISPLFILQKQATMLQPTISCMNFFLPYLQLDPHLAAYIDFRGLIHVAREATNADVRIINDDDTAQKILDAQAENERNQLELENQIRQQDANNKAYLASSKAPEQGSPAAQQAMQSPLTLR